ncbi:uncharacterized protein UTRI_06027 [Ustilago trichophora]|uniref:Uncharacterized protein n=1 Tax=Ustilago trichophora TaxID=86804 RepID=A0A5C3EHY9_9BASI|nr:uncharacterized protein UTRI_06027 [Ustilago trichophora]
MARRGHMLYQPVSVSSGRHPWGATHFIPPLIYASFISLPQASCSPSLMTTRPWPSLPRASLVAPLPYVPGGAFSRSARTDRRVDATCRFPSEKSASELHLPAEYLCTCAPFLRTAAAALLRPPLVPDPGQPT